MDPCLLDTDILSEVLRGRNQDIADAANAYLKVHGQFAISAFTRFEVGAWVPLEKATAKLNTFEQLCTSMTIYPVTDDALDRAADLWADGATQGKPEMDADIIIAATALIHGRELVTGNLPRLRLDQRPDRIDLAEVTSLLRNPTASLTRRPEWYMRTMRALSRRAVGRQAWISAFTSFGAIARMVSLPSLSDTTLPVTQAYFMRERAIAGKCNNQRSRAAAQPLQPGEGLNALVMRSESDMRLYGPIDRERAVILMTTAQSRTPWIGGAGEDYLPARLLDFKGALLLPSARAR